MRNNIQPVQESNFMKAPQSFKAHNLHIALGNNVKAKIEKTTYGEINIHLENGGILTIKNPKNFNQDGLGLKCLYGIATDELLEEMNPERIPEGVLICYHNTYQEYIYLRKAG